MAKTYTPDQLAEMPITNLEIVPKYHTLDTKRQIRSLVRSALSQAGKREIAGDDFFRHRDSTDEEDRFDWRVEAPNLPRLSRRVASYVYKTYELRLEESDLGRIGEFASNDRVRAIVDMTNSFNWMSGDYGDGNSCYWGGYKKARLDYLPRLGASAVRIYQKNGERYIGNGRFWVVPVFGEKNQFVTFNYYGGFGDVNFARNVFVQLLKMQRQDIDWIADPTHLNIESCYVNEPTKWFCRPSEIPAPEVITFVSRMWQVSTFGVPEWASRYIDYCTCRTCGERIPVDDSQEYSGYHYCQECYDQLFRDCGMCGYRDVTENMTQVDGMHLCRNCTARYTITCDICEARHVAISPVFAHVVPHNFVIVTDMNDNDVVACQDCAGRCQCCPHCNNIYTQNAMESHMADSACHHHYHDGFHILFSGLE